MLSTIAKFLLYRVVGGRVMLAMALLGLARRVLGGRRRTDGSNGSSLPPADAGRSSSAYQPSQGSSQIVQRDPR